MIDFGFHRRRTTGNDTGWGRGELKRLNRYKVKERW
jgi:hypothetical protein